MADLLNFPVDRVRVSGDKPAAGDAEVLIFPGVRIERGDFSLSDRLPPRSRHRKASPARAARSKDVGKRRK